MANVFGILTLFALLSAGFLALKNKEKYQLEIEETAKRKQELKVSQERLETARKNVADTIDERKGVDEEVVTLTEEDNAQRENNEKLKKDIESKTAEVESNKQELDAIRDKTAKIGDLQDLASQMRTTKAELEELQQNITASEAKLANLTAVNEQTETQSGNMKTKFEIISSGRSLPTLNTRIRSIYPTWGFVTLAAGNNGGVVSNSKLDVVRDDTVIAQLLVTSVERSSASASIVPDSLAPDTVLMVGDRVVPTKPEEKPVVTPPPVEKPALEDKASEEEAPAEPAAEEEAATDDPFAEAPAEQEPAEDKEPAGEEDPFGE